MAGPTKVKVLTNDRGVKEAVLVSIDEYRQLREAFEELASIAAYDEAMRADDEVLPFEHALAELGPQEG